MRVDSLIQDVPLVLSAVPNVASTFNMVGFMFNNPTAAQITIELQDGNGNVLLPIQGLPSGALMIVPSYLLPVVAGAKWIAGAVGIKGQVWGYQ